MKESRKGFTKPKNADKMELIKQAKNRRSRYWIQPKSHWKRHWKNFWKRNLLIRSPSQIWQRTAGSAAWHFTIISMDIYDLVEWACVEDGKKPFGIRKLTIPGRKALPRSLRQCWKTSRLLWTSIIRWDVKRSRVFYTNWHTQLIADVVEEKCSRDHLPETDKQFIADFYKYGFVGIMLDWIDRGMKEDYQKIVDLLAVTLHGNIAIPSLILNRWRKKCNLR